MISRIVFALFLTFVALSASAPARMAAPSKPVWPGQFSSPFGLNVLLPPVTNGSAMFYYNWNITSTLINYQTHCLPFVHWDSVFYPCDLYFNSEGCFVHAPAINISCCTLFAGVGSVPPQFLRAFNYTGVETAKDLSGTTHTCDYWTGDDFAYWTDSTTGFDVQFKDGPTGVYWNWGNFNVVSQNPSIFALPSGADVNCSSECHMLFDELAPQPEEIMDPWIRHALQFHKLKEEGLVDLDDLIA